MQRYWTILTPTEWSGADVSEWDTLLLEPVGISSVLHAVSAPSEVIASGVAGHSGSAAAVSGGSVLSADGEVIARTKVGGVYVQAAPSLVMGEGVVAIGGTAVCRAGLSSVTTESRKGTVGNVVAQAGVAFAGTPIGNIQGSVIAESMPSSISASGQVKTRIDGDAVCFVGDATIIAAAGTQVVVSAILIESVRVIDSSFTAIRNPVSTIMLMPNSYALATIRGGCHKWAVKRGQNEIDLFLDDREIVIDVGRYQ